MKLALVSPPTCDPTAPYLALGALAAALRPAGVETLLVDANLEAWEHVLAPAHLLQLAGIQLALLEEQLAHFPFEVVLVHEAPSKRGHPPTS